MTDYTTRDPTPKHRDPRQYVAAVPPPSCPKCGAPTRMTDGRHVDLQTRRIMEYRTCQQCGKRVAAGRGMTPFEVSQSFR